MDPIYYSTPDLEIITLFKLNSSEHEILTAC